MGWVTVGIVLQVFGAAATGSGLWKTFHTNKLPGERFFRRPAWLASLRAKWRDRQAKKHEAQFTDPAGTTDALTAAEDAKTRTYNPPFGMFPSEQIQWLTPRFLALAAKVDSAYDAMANDRRQLHQTTERLQRTTDEYAAQLREEARKAAYGGVRRQALGLFFVTVGVLIAAVPTYTTPADPGPAETTSPAKASPSTTKRPSPTKGDGRSRALTYSADIASANSFHTPRRV